MSLHKLIIALLLVLLGLAVCGQQERFDDPDPFSRVRGAYLGQDPPGVTPRIFAPGLISTDKDEGGLTVFPGGRELYFWTVESGEKGPRAAIYVTMERNGSWTRPEVASFSGEFNDGYPALHPDGSRLFFQSDRPIDPAESLFKYNIWYVDRDGDGWSEAKSIGRPVNGKNHTGGASVTRTGTLYFTLMDIRTGFSELYRSEFAGGSYQEPLRLPDGINAFYQNTDSYVDPDDRYMVFSAFERRGHEDNPGALYIAFRDSDGLWGDATKLGPVLNSKDQFGSITISPDGKYLFFTRKKEQNDAVLMGLDLYWVDAAVLDEQDESH